jgi:hypothetical protein
MSKPRKSTAKRNRRAYDGVEAVIASNRPGERGKVTSVLRDGIWRTPRTPKGESALPPVKMPRVRVS